MIIIPLGIIIIAMVTIKDAVEQGYVKVVEYYYNSYGYYPNYCLKDLPGESLDSKNYVMAFLQYDNIVDFRLNSSLGNRSFNVIYSCGAPVSTYYINGNGIYFITIVPYNWNIKNI